MSTNKTRVMGIERKREERFAVSHPCLQQRHPSFGISKWWRSGDQTTDPALNHPGSMGDVGRNDSEAEYPGQEITYHHRIS
jgi:hypothetical protein